MSEKVTLNTLDKGQAVLLERLTNIQTDVELKHAQNRGSIHHLNTMVQHCIDDIWKLKLKIAGYSALAGVATSVAIHYVEKLLK